MESACTKLLTFSVLLYKTEKIKIVRGSKNTIAKIKHDSREIAMK